MLSLATALLAVTRPVTGHSRRSALAGLVALQLAYALLDESLRAFLGYGTTLAGPSGWLGGPVLSSPGTHARARTPE